MRTQGYNINKPVCSQKNVFYETDCTTDFDDKVKIEIMRLKGFNVVLTTCNKGITFSRIQALHWRALSMYGPWTVDGNVSGTSSGAVKARADIDNASGSATDGLMGYWHGDIENAQSPVFAVKE